MEKDNHIQFPVDSAAERIEHPAPPFVPKPRPPLTPEEIEADRQLIEMIGLNPNDLSEERLRELCKIWE